MDGSPPPSEAIAHAHAAAAAAASNAQPAMDEMHIAHDPHGSGEAAEIPPDIVAAARSSGAVVFSLRLMPSGSNELDNGHPWTSAESDPEFARALQAVLARLNPHLNEEHRPEAALMPLQRSQEAGLLFESVQDARSGRIRLNPPPYLELPPAAAAAAVVSQAPDASSRPSPGFLSPADGAARVHAALDAPEVVAAAAGVTAAYEAAFPAGEPIRFDAAGGVPAPVPAAVAAPVDPLDEEAVYSDSDEEEMVEQALDAIEQANREMHEANRAQEHDRRTAQRLEALIIESERNIYTAGDAMYQFVSHLPSTCLNEEVTIAITLTAIKCRHPEWLSDETIAILCSSKFCAHNFASAWMRKAKPNSRDALACLAAFLNKFHHSDGFQVMIPTFPNWPNPATTHEIEIAFNLITNQANRSWLLLNILTLRVPHIPQSSMVHARCAVMTLMKAQDNDPGIRGWLWSKWLQTVPDCVVSTENLLDSNWFSLCAEHNRRVQLMRHRISIAQETTAGKLKREMTEAIINIVDEAAPEDAMPDSLCAICIINFPRVCLVPCGHINMCGACSRQLFNGQRQGTPECPTCRKPITHAQPCFLPSVYHPAQAAANAANAAGSARAAAAAATAAAASAAPPRKRTRRQLRG